MTYDKLWSNQYLILFDIELIHVLFNTTRSFFFLEFENLFDKIFYFFYLLNCFSRCIIFYLIVSMIIFVFDRLICFVYYIMKIFLFRVLRWTRFVFLFVFIIEYIKLTTILVVLINSKFYVFISLFCFYVFLCNSRAFFRNVFFLTRNWISSFCKYWEYRK